jgi:two-component system, OmpR family, copper resistance phosphate regulon response regulator CusR
MKILLIEDEAGIANFISLGLTDEGFEVEVFSNGLEGLNHGLMNASKYSLILLDWMLPGKSGIEICTELRANNIETPILFLTAKDTVEDAVMGLEAGANDYIRKPFAFEELLARVKAHTRQSESKSVYSVRNLEMNLDKHTITKDGELISLTQKEFALFEYFLKNKGNVCKRTSIIEEVWDIHFDYDDSVIDVYINALRKKLDNPGTPSVIQTIRGIGYKVED